MQWVRMFVKWRGLRHPRDKVQVEIERFPGVLPWHLQPGCMTAFEHHPEDCSGS